MNYRASAKRPATSMSDRGHLDLWTAPGVRACHSWEGEGLEEVSGWDGHARPAALGFPLLYCFHPGKSERRRRDLGPRSPYIFLSDFSSPKHRRDLAWCLRWGKDGWQPSKAARRRGCEKRPDISVRARGPTGGRQRGGLGSLEPLCGQGAGPRALSLSLPPLCPSYGKI